jgi:hypothetical protein
MEDNSAMAIPVVDITSSVPGISGIQVFFTRFLSYNSVFFAVVFVLVIVHRVLKTLLWEWLACIMSCCSKKTKQIETKVLSRYWENVSSVQMINEIGLYNQQAIHFVKQHPVLDLIKEMHWRRVAAYQEILKTQQVMANGQLVSSITVMSSSTKFIGTSSFDVRLNKEYKKYFYRTMTKEEAIAAKMPEINMTAIIKDTKDADGLLVDSIPFEKDQENSDQGLKNNQDPEPKVNVDNSGSGVV